MGCSLSMTNHRRFDPISMFRCYSWFLMMNLIQFQVSQDFVKCSQTNSFWFEWRRKGFVVDQTFLFSFVLVTHRVLLSSAFMCRYHRRLYLLVTCARRQWCFCPLNKNKIHRSGPVSATVWTSEWISVRAAPIAAPPPPRKKTIEKGAIVMPLVRPFRIRPSTTKPPRSYLMTAGVAT